MPDSSAPAVRRVKLKRVAALQPSDVIQPGLGLFMKTGMRLQSQASMTDTWTRAPWVVVETPEMIFGKMEWHVKLNDPQNTTGDSLFTPLDAYVVLAS